MSRIALPQPSVPSAGAEPVHAVQVFGGGEITGAHVRSLAAGLAAHGLRVTVTSPPGAAEPQDFAASGARIAAGRIRTDPEAVAALRRRCRDARLVHAHGLRAGLLASLALAGRRPPVPLVVTWHGHEPVAGARAPLLRLLERRVARSASVVLGTTTQLVDLARRRGARDARLAPVTVPGPPADDDGAAQKIRARLGAMGRPLLVSAGPLIRHQGHHTTLTAARAWRGLDPQPLLVLAGDGPEHAALQRRIGEEDLPVLLLGTGDEAPALLAAADLVLLPSRRGARPARVRQVLRAGAALVAADTGEVPETAGDGAALVPYGDAAALAATVTSLLRDPSARDRLAARGRERARDWPGERSTLEQVLAVYDELTAAGPAGRGGEAHPGVVW